MTEPLIQRTDVWYEKYRPETLNDIILPPVVKSKLEAYLKDGGYGMPHLGLFSRTPGTGKSSLAKVILKDTQAEALWINASLDKGIDILRTKIQRFSAAAPLRETVKIVVMDEFDHFSRDGQAAFRGFIDEFGKNVRFIFTGNYKENIIEPLLDRLEVYDFNQFQKEDMIKPIFIRLCDILDKEGIEYQKEDVAGIIKQNYPRIRKMIGDLGQNIQNGKLDFAAGKDSQDLETLANLIKSKSYLEAIKAVYSLGSTDHVFTYFGSNLHLITSKQEATVNAIIILAKYQNMHMTARDRHLNAAACCCELMKI